MLFSVGTRENNALPKLKCVLKPFFLEKGTGYRPTDVAGV